MWRLILILLLTVLCACRKDGKVREAFAAKTGEVTLPAGDFTLSAPLVIDGAKKLTIRGNGTRLVMGVEAEAAIVIRNAGEVRLENMTIEGNRDSVQRSFTLPPSDQSMARFNKNNGILVEQSDNVTLSKLTIRKVHSYPVLVSHSNHVTVEEALIGDSGGLDEKSQNNATGGILFEEGCEHFAVRKSKIRNVRGNGIWTHSLYRSPRNQHGEFAENDVRHVGRDAFQVGHAVDVKVVHNTGGFIGYPSSIVDTQHLAVPVAIDTAGNVEGSLYADNQFEEVNGKCIDLDGFHDGSVQRNACINRRDLAAYPNGHFAIVLNNSNPDMRSRNIQILDNRMEGFRYGAVFLIGEGHLVKGNSFVRVNLTRCGDIPDPRCQYWPGEPDLLRSGIYFGKGAERPDPSTRNVVEDNLISGFGMEKRCSAAAPGMVGNVFRGNRCVEKE